MGQQNSSGYDDYDFHHGSNSRRGRGGGGGGSGGDPSEAKTCYYELLAVERTATQDEIKKAYKRKALELHPDRNYNDEARATQLFAEVQAAYEVLSDPQERAWYDSHRDQILRGDSSPGEQDHAPPSNVTTAPTVLRWIGVFARPRSYEDNDPAGFFTVIGKAFAQLAEEEVAAADWAGEDAVEYPSFGNSTKPYDGRGGVREFYTAWTNFATTKSFAWEDLYRYSDAPDRRIKRLMEKENQRAREAAKREFNDAVRGFVMFVRKRDPRYLPNTQTEAQRQQVVRDMAKEQARKQRAQNAKDRAEYKIADWAKGEEGAEVEEWLSSEPEDDSDEEEEEEIEVFECIVCRKKFGSQGQMDAHENSKKHRQAVEKLKRQMKAEDREFDLDRDVRGREKKEEEFTPLDEDGDEEEFDDDDEDLAELEAYKAEGAVQNEEMPPTSENGEEENTEEENKEDTNGKEEKLNASKPDDQPPTSLSPDEPASSTESSAEDSDHISRAKFEERILGEYDHVTDRFASASLLSDDDSNTQGSTSTPPQKMGKAKAKRAKRAAAASAAAEKDTSSASTEFMCAGCKNQFGSKTKLFNHLKENPGHAKLVDGGGKGKKKGKGKR